MQPQIERTTVFDGMNFTAIDDLALPSDSASQVREVPAMSADVADWSRERKATFEWAPSRFLLASIRDYQRLLNSRGMLPRWLRRLAALRHRWWTMITGADIPLNCKLGGGLLLPHPNGVVIHPNAEIGPNCSLFHQVTIGEAAGGVPTLEGHVDVGAGAKIIGQLKVGQHAKIGANAVVLDDVPAGATARGRPGKDHPALRFAIPGDFPHYRC
jgi:serine O-acetyltransferase